MRGELQSVQRELQVARDEAKSVVNSRERLSQELQTKQAQVCSLEGQLDAARTLHNKLSQDVKRLESEEIYVKHIFYIVIFLLNCRYVYKIQLILKRFVVITNTP